MQYEVVGEIKKNSVGRSVTTIRFPDGSIRLFVPIDDMFEAIKEAYNIVGETQPTIYPDSRTTIRFFKRRVRIAIWKLINKE